MNDRPYLSVIVTSRNDNHGGTLLRRMQIFTDCLIAQCRRHDLAAELIVVEWNPPTDRGPLMEALRWPVDCAPCDIRFITVPPELHARYKHGKHLPLYQMIAKNVGIRRARGEFILATNIDVILNDELMAFIAARKLEKGKMYRIDRTDADALVPENAPLDEVLDYCRKHVLRINAREGTFPMRPDGLRAIAPHDIARHEAIVSLGNGWFEPQRDGEDRPYRWVSNDAEIWLQYPPDTPASAAPKYMTLDVEPGPTAGGSPLLLHAVGDDGVMLTKMLVTGRQPLMVPIVLSPGRLDRITLHVKPLFPNPRAATLDPRCMNLMVRCVELSKAPPLLTFEGALPDITDEGIALGPGWYPPELNDGHPFRWAGNDLDLWLRPDGRPFLEIDLEPGPSLGREPFTLHPQVEENSLAEQVIMGRRKIHLPMPPTEADQWVRAKLKIDGPSHGVPGDSRLLSTGVFSVRWTDTQEPSNAPSAPDDVAAMGVEVLYGKGWHGPECYDHHWFRWAENDAKIFILSDATEQHPRHLQLDIGRGPSLGGKPARLEAQDDNGNVTGHLDNAWGTLRLKLTRPLSRVTLHVDSPNLPVKNDPRILNFRVNGVAMEKAGTDSVVQGGTTATPSESHDSTLPEPGNVPGPAPLPPVHLHTNACGDFTLLHRDHWFELRGYAEWDVFSINIDSLFCFTAHHGRAPETILPEPMRLYHIEHNVGSGWTPEGQQMLLQRIRKLGIPDVHWTEVAQLGAFMNTYQAPMIFCGDDWGLAADDLPETAPATGTASP